MGFLVRSLVTAFLVAVAYALTSHGPVMAQGDTAGPFKTRAFQDTDGSGSPNGGLVVGHKDNAAGRLYLRDLKTAVERALVDLEGTVDHLVWSPDSQQLAFTFTPKAPAAAEVRAVSIATGASRTLTASGSVLAWTARNEILVTARRFLSNVDWLLIPVDGGPSRVIFTSPSGLQAGGLSADGTSLIFAKSGRIVLHRLASGLERTVTAIDAAERFLAMSPDGRLLAFASDMGGGWAVYIAPLDRLPVTRPLRIASLEGGPDSAAGWWTRDGVLALAHVTYSGIPLYSVDVDAKSGRASGTLRRLTRGAFDTAPIASPDSKQVAYRFGDDDATGVGVVDVSSGAARRVLTYGPGLSPLAFAWRSREELVLYHPGATPPGFAALKVGTGEIVPLTAATIARRGFNYVPQTREVLYAVGNSNAPGVVLKALSLATGAERAIATVDFLFGFQASPDAGHIVYSRWLEAPGQGRNPDSELRLMKMDGTPEKLLLATRRGMLYLRAWSPDGRFLLYFDGNDVPRVLNIETLESWPLLDTADQPEWYWQEATWAPDGSFIVMTGDSTWQEPHVRAWEGVTYEAVTRLPARGGK